MSYAVYRLVDPRTQSTFYVGVTDNLAARYIQHLRCSDKNTRKNTRIQEIKDANYLPIPDTLEIIEERTLALKRERYWIQHYRHLGADLLNAMFPAREFEPEAVEQVTTVEVQPSTRLIGLTYKDAARLLICRQKQIKVSDLRTAVKRGELKEKSDGSLAKSAVENWARDFITPVYKAAGSSRAKVSDAEIIAFRAANPNMTASDVANHFGISVSKVNHARPQNLQKAEGAGD
jgi:predicted GIY-YIG superfamily endonuclease